MSNILDMKEVWDNAYLLFQEYFDCFLPPEEIIEFYEKALLKKRLRGREKGRMKKLIKDARKRMDEERLCRKFVYGSGRFETDEDA